MGQAAHHYLIFDTAGGFCGIAWNDAGIRRFQLPTKSVEATERILLRHVPGAKPGAPTPEVAEAVAAVRRYFEGAETDFSSVKLDLGEQDPFFERVYAAARRVAWGHTTTYGALAKELGAGPEAARDVGQAMAKNPVALMIPCHRVLAAAGKVGGFSAPGGSASLDPALAHQRSAGLQLRANPEPFGLLQLQPDLAELALHLNAQPTRGDFPDQTVDRTHQQLTAEGAAEFPVQAVACTC